MDTELAYFARNRDGPVEPIGHVSFEEVDNEEVCVIYVDASPDPVYFKEKNNDTKFHVRAGSSSEPLTIQEANQYIAQNWS